MRHNPIRTNFLENTGVYLWQIVAWVADSCPPANKPAELKRVSPPLLKNAFMVWGETIDSNSLIKWSPKAKVTPAINHPLLSLRGSRVSIAVNIEAQSFVEVHTDISEMLKSPTNLAKLSELASYGNETSISNAVISLTRHGILELTPQPSFPLWGIRCEPFVEITPGKGDTVLISNMLTGRILQSHVETANIVDALREPAPITQPLNNSLRTLVEAGVLRLVGKP